MPDLRVTDAYDTAPSPVPDFNEDHFVVSNELIASIGEIETCFARQEGRTGCFSELEVWVRGKLLPIVVAIPVLAKNDAFAECGITCQRPKQSDSDNRNS